MSTSAIVTRGFLFSIALTVTAGYESGTPPVPPPPSGHHRTGGGKHAHRRKNYWQPDDDARHAPIVPLVPSADLADHLYGSETPVAVPAITPPDQPGIAAVADVSGELRNLQRLGVDIERGRQAALARDREASRANREASRIAAQERALENERQAIAAALAKRRRDDEELILLDLI